MKLTLVCLLLIVPAISFASVRHSGQSRECVNPNLNDLDIGEVATAEVSPVERAILAEKGYRSALGTFNADLREAPPAVQAIFQSQVYFDRLALKSEIKRLSVSDQTIAYVLLEDKSQLRRASIAKRRYDAQAAGCGYRPQD